MIYICFVILENLIEIIILLINQSNEKEECLSCRYCSENPTKNGVHAQYFVEISFIAIFTLVLLVCGHRERETKQTVFEHITCFH